MRRLELKGEKFGHLLVSGPSEAVYDKKGRARTRWLCLCECGEGRIALTEGLRSGEVISCCNPRCRFHRPIRLASPSEGSFRSLLRNYKRNAANKGHEFKLTNEEFRVLTSSDCRYCGDAPSNQWTSVRLNSTKTMPYIFNGVDRVDSSKGYTISNCVPCCKTCNSMKLDMTVESFVNHIKKVVAHLETETTI